VNKIGIIILSPVLAMAVGLSSCVAPLAPPPEVLPPAPPEAPLPEPNPWDSIEVIQIPSEAHIGDYITAQVKVPNYDTVNWPYHEYLLKLTREPPTTDDRIAGWEFGCKHPDYENVVSWHVRIPITYIDYKGRERLFPVGSWQLKVIGWANGGPVVVNRNIIIKE